LLAAADLMDIAAGVETDTVLATVQFLPNIEEC